MDADALTLGLGLQILQALLDGVLMGAGESGVDQIPRIRLAGRYRHAGAVFDGAPHFVQPAEIDLRIDALRVQVHAQGDQIDVSGALAMSEQAALDTVGARHQTELRGRDGGAAIVVGVQRDTDAVSRVDVAAEVFDLVGVGVRSAHLDRCRQVQDDLTVGVRLPHIDHAVADLDCELGRGLGEDLR